MTSTVKFVFIIHAEKNTNNDENRNEINEELNIKSITTKIHTYCIHHGSCSENQDLTR